MMAFGQRTRECFACGLPRNPALSTANIKTALKKKGLPWKEPAVANL
jgi:hypothetical protein